ncbi:hypothetical protein CCUS01_14388 [Colletotrichum cuscutae]|uniref:Uncharacterized protein n=1 Tax=Colletotrichum cuscutae TaxID=1209917 RepID=A0AAJ0DLG3_9PEZI|nr:hypothetical protein CCUS01_14388 [Colletotrichum cuscutae]
MPLGGHSTALASVTTALGVNSDAYMGRSQLLFLPKACYDVVLLYCTHPIPHFPVGNYALRRPWFCDSLICLPRLVFL